MWIPILLAFLYASWVFWSRHQENRQAAEDAQAAEAKRDAQVTEALGGGQIKVLAFYAEPGVVRPGERALVCYGVSNAKTVRIDPHIADLTPSLSRCLEVHPKQTTDFKISAKDAQGHEATESFTLRVAK